MTFKEDLYLSNALLHRRLSAIAEDEFASLGMSPSHAFVLLQVIRKSGCQPGWVGERLGLAPSTITRIVDKLIRMQLLEKKSKGRAQSLHPTEMGREYETRIESVWRKVKSRVNFEIGEERATALALELRQVERGL